MTTEKTINLARYRVLAGRVRDQIAAAGSTGADATPLNATWNRITSVPPGSGVKLLPAIAGLSMFVQKADYLPSTALIVYAEVGDEIANGAGAVVLSGYSSFEARCFTEGQWDIIGSYGSLHFLGAAELAGAGGASLGPVELLAGAASIGALAGSGQIGASSIQRELAQATMAGQGAVAAVAG